MRFRFAAAVAGSSLLLFASAGVAQGAGGAGLTPATVCLLTRAEVEKEIGRKLSADPDGMPLAFRGAMCEYFNGTDIIYFSGPKAEANWEGMMKELNFDVSKRTPVPGLGAPAFVVYPPSRIPQQGPLATVVVKKGPHLLAVSHRVALGKPAEAALERTLALVRIALPRLK